MALTGRCYCGALRYEAGGDPLLKLQCHCCECQYFTGGHPLPIVFMSEAAFQYTAGEAKAFRRSDLPAPGTREFCPTCGTHVLTRAPGMPGLVGLRAGTLDDPSVFDRPHAVIFTVDKQAFHHVPEGVPVYERVW